MSEPFRDLHAAIVDVSRHYHFQEMPGLLINLQELITNLLRWLSDFLAKLFALAPAASDTRAFGDLIKYLWYMVGFVCSLVLLYVIIQHSRQVLFKVRTSVGDGQITTKIMDGSDWIKEATRLAEQTDWRSACRALYMACLRIFDESGILTFTPSRTNYEYWYALQKDKTIQKRFRELADVVDGSWFGNLTVGQVEFGKCLAVLEEIRREIASGNYKGAPMTRPSSQKR